MGKIRRARQKFHQTSPKDIKLNTFESVDPVESFQKQLIGKSPLLKSAEEFAAIPDNLFEGIDINFDDLKKKITEDDRVSVRSIAKSCKYDSKGKLLTKKEKQRLKHDLFMRKINTVQQLKKEALQKHKKRKGLKKSELQVNTLIEQTPLVGMEIGSQNTILDNKVDTFTKKDRKIKSKSIKKSKVRQKEMLQEIFAFRNILSDPKFTEDPCATITECVQKRIVKGVKRK